MLTEKNKFIIKRDITLDSISFAYENSQVLTDINITINARSIVGIVGSSGAGKSTLLNILLGLIRPTKGSLLVDGKEIKSKKDISSWQKSIGFVSQDIFLGVLTMFSQAIGKRRTRNSPTRVTFM